MKLETVANVTIIGTALAIIGNLGFQRYESMAARRPDYRSGDIIKPTEAVRFQGHPLTLLLVTASTCHFCTASTPFYQRLVSTAHDYDVKVIGVTAEDPTLNQAYLAKHGVTVDTVVSAAGNQIVVRGTPTLILVTSSGRVLDAWHGQLDSREEQRVLKAIMTVRHKP
jgi:peroxiredoxin